jgi:hypothetical protein
MFVPHIHPAVVLDTSSIHSTIKNNTNVVFKEPDIGVERLTQGKPRHGVTRQCRHSDVLCAKTSLVTTLP